MNRRPDGPDNDELNDPESQQLLNYGQPRLPSFEEYEQYGADDDEPTEAR